MNRIRLNIAILVAASALLAACGTHEDVAERYRLEKLLWQAQLHEREINIAFLQASQRGLILATEAFTNVLAYDPLEDPRSARWDPVVVRDIERIQLVSKIALANLYFLGEQYYDAGEFYNRSLRWPELGFNNELDIRLNLARTMYLAGETDSLRNHCEVLFRQINESRAFWGGGVRLKEVFLQVPVFLVRFHADRGDDRRARELGGVASDFYHRVARTWPDSSVADEARSAHVQLHLVLENWARAIEELDGLAGRPAAIRDPGNLLLLKAEILAYGLGDTRSGEAIFRELAGRYPGKPVSYMARYNLAVLGLKQGERAGPERILKELEDEAAGEPEIAARAMLTLALHLEQTSRWDEALPLIRRVLRLYPHTEAAVEAPLIVTAHYVSGNNEALATRSLERATEFYLSLISKQSNYSGNRLLLEDVMIRNYLLVGRAADAAVLLEEESVEWDEASTAAALLKAAEIYILILDDQEGAARTLKKCIELFPETRYAKLAQARLNSLEEG
jgi:TolA-binding protein